MAGRAHVCAPHRAGPGEAALNIAIYHGYELSGSGSNEYTRYLARTLAEQGHRVTLICREPSPEAFEFVSRAVSYTTSGEPTELFRRSGDETGQVTLHQLPATSCYPVFVKDKQREGTVKSFPEMSDGELAEYHSAMVAVVSRVLRDERPELLHANHLVYQPQVAMEACRETGTPFYIVPHGSSIEYTVKVDPGFRAAARQALECCDGVVWITDEVRERVCLLFPDLRPVILAKSRRVGVGTDTSLFRPLARADRASAVQELIERHRTGGKTAGLRAHLRGRLRRGEIEAVRDYWEAYDHSLPDDDLPRRLAGVDLDRDLLIYVGALTYGKGVQSLIGAMPEILARRPDTELLVVGAGTYREVLEGLVHAISEGDHALFDAIVGRGGELDRGALVGPLEDLRLHVAEPVNRERLFRLGRGLTRRVHFVGRLDHPMLRCLLPCCRLAVFPSLVHEASPLVFYESMANGVLPVGSRHSGLQEGIEDLRPHVSHAIACNIGLPVDPQGRIAGMAERISKLLDDPEVGDLGPRLRTLAVERHDWRVISESLIRAVAPWADRSRYEAVS